MTKPKRKRIKRKDMPDFNAYSKQQLEDFIANPPDPHQVEEAKAHLKYRIDLIDYAESVTTSAYAGIGSNPIGNPPPPPGS